MEAGDQEGELSLAPPTLTQCPLSPDLSYKYAKSSTSAVWARPPRRPATRRAGLVHCAGLYAAQNSRGSSEGSGLARAASVTQPVTAKARPGPGGISSPVTVTLMWLRSKGRPAGSRSSEGKGPPSLFTGSLACVAGRPCEEACPPSFNLLVKR